MIYGYHKLERHALYAIHKELGHFFETIAVTDQFSDALFQEWFLPVLHKCQRLKDILQLIFVQLKKSGSPSAHDFIKIFKNNNQIEMLCRNPKSMLLEWKTNDKDLNKHLLELAEYLYDELPERQSLLDAIDGGGYRNYYKEFREQNTGTVCPFCGIDNLPDYFQDERDSKLPRASYDHYLCRTRFPLSAINFDNLIPTCKHCNENAKGAKPMILSEGGKRRKAIYPFNSPFQFNFILSQTEAAGIDEKAKWAVDIVAKRAADNEAVRTWLSVYNIKDRWEARVEGRAKHWEICTLQEMLTDFEDLTALKGKLNAKRITYTCESYLKDEVDGILKLAFFDYLSSLDNARLRSTVVALKLIAATQPKDLLAI